MTYTKYIAGHMSIVCHTSLSGCYRTTVTTMYYMNGGAYVWEDTTIVSGRGGNRACMVTFKVTNLITVSVHTLAAALSAINQRPMCLH